ncbi:MAG: DUF1523 family protein [Gemmobacter sp.]|nr:DUF1523 family protein [Gemmobacter sp.]
MRWVIRSVVAILVLLVLSVLHYTLPQHDIVRVVGTENRRIDFGENSFFWSGPDVGTAPGMQRDVFFIQTVQPNGKPMVYRNEDTGWGWPPYFKLNSHNLQTIANSLASSAEAPKWVAITHYGWRNEFFTIFPNAIALRQVAGPDTRIIPWMSIIILVLLLALAVLIWRMLAQFRERMIDPFVDQVGDRIDDIDARADQARDRARGIWGRFVAWLATWRGKPRR